MQSKAKTVKGYLDEVPENRREALERIRDLCIEILEGYEESMAYGMPSYKNRGGNIEVAFASQKNYISLYILKKDVLDKHRESLKRLNLGRGCIRYTKPEKINYDIVKQLLVDSLQSNSAIC